MKPPVHLLNRTLRFQSFLAWGLVIGSMIGFSGVRMSSAALAGSALLCLIAGLVLLIITEIQIGLKRPHPGGEILRRTIRSIALLFLLLGLFMILNGIILFGTLLMLPSAALLLFSRARKNLRNATGSAPQQKNGASSKTPDSDLSPLR